MSRIFSRRNIPLVAAIVFALALLGVAVYTTVVRSNDPALEVIRDQGPPPRTGAEGVRGVQADDHILGAPNAPLVLIVYSDFACPFCKEYHATMRRIITTYGQNGDVAWVFRHLPVVKLHEQAPVYALASECVTAQLGNAGFWKYADLLFDMVTPEKPLEAEDLVALATQAGATRDTFVTCMRDNALMKDVEEDYAEAIRAGAKGTPYTIVATPFQRVPLEGASSYAAVAAAVETVIKTMSVLPKEGLERPSDTMRQYFEDAAASSSPTLDP